MQTYNVPYQGNEVEELVNTIHQLKQMRTQRRLQSGIMGIMSQGLEPQAQQQQIAQLILQEQAPKAHKPGLGGFMGRVLDAFNPNVASNLAGSPIEDLITGRQMQGLFPTPMEKASLESTKARTAYYKRPQTQTAPKTVSGVDRVWQWNEESGAYEKTNIPVKKPGKYGDPIAGGEGKILPEGWLFQKRPDGGINVIQKPPEEKYAMVTTYDKDGNQQTKRIPVGQINKHMKEVKATGGSEEKPEKTRIEELMAEGYDDETAKMILDISHGITPRKSSRATYDDMDDVEKMKFLQTLLDSARGQYYGIESGHKEPLSPKVAEWAEEELAKLPMFKEQTNEPQTVEEFYQKVAELKASGDMQKAKAYYDEWVDKW